MKRIDSRSQCDGPQERIGFILGYLGWDADDCDDPALDKIVNYIERAVNEKAARHGRFPLFRRRTQP